jgi:hypothetical protein
MFVKNRHEGRHAQAVIIAINTMPIILAMEGIFFNNDAGMVRMATPIMPIDKNGIIPNSMPLVFPRLAEPF